MSGFGLDWLRLRAPFDEAARSRRLLQRFVRHLPRPARLLDLGAGTGATLRAVAPAIDAAQSWVLIDSDATLLDAVAQEMSSCGWTVARTSDGMELSGPHRHIRVVLRQADLTDQVDHLDLAETDAVVASALLDLVSGAWSERLARRCTAFRVPLYLALSFDGRLSWDPPDARDNFVRRAFLHHQRRDKGFGPALGPQAPRAVAEQLTRLGFDVARAASDWCIGPQDRPMHHAFLDAVEAAAREQAPSSQSVIAAWGSTRRRQIDAGALSVRVGHQDLLACPPPLNRA